MLNTCISGADAKVESLDIDDFNSWYVY